MTLLERLQNAYSETKNFKNKNFIPFHIARAIVTVDQIHEWSETHPLCQRYRCEGRHRIDLPQIILKDNVLVFVVLVFARLEFLMCQLIESGSTDMMLFHTQLFENICQLAVLSAEQKQGLVSYRKYVGVIFGTSGIQNIPDNFVLPFLKRENLNTDGGNGVLFKVQIPGQHLQNQNDSVR